MDHIAIDLGGQESQICVRGRDGTILEERPFPTALLKEYLAARGHGRVILETSAEAFKVADIAVELGHEVRVVPASLVPSLGVGAGGVKTDRRDARILSEVSTRIELPSVHVPSELSRVRKAMCTSREAIVTVRTKLINTVRGWMRTQLLSINSGAPCTFPLRVRKVALATPSGLPDHIDQLLVIIDAHNTQISRADRQLREWASKDALCQRLMTVPGVGPTTAIRFVAALDDVTRFPNAHAVERYLGLVPGEDSSSTRKRRTGITKAGAPRMRWALVQAAWAMRRTNRVDPLVLWTKEVEKRRGKMIAAVALARRIAGILYALWRDGTRYEPSKLQR